MFEEANAELEEIAIGLIVSLKRPEDTTVASCRRYR